MGNKTQSTSLEIRERIENNLLGTKVLYYLSLAFFFTGTAFISYLVAAFLFIGLMIVLVFLWFLTGHDVELIRMFLRYEFPGLFGPY